jgi:hypothetical protein
MTKKNVITKLVDYNSILSSLFVSILIIIAYVTIIKTIDNDLALIITLSLFGLFLLFNLSINETLTLTKKSIIHKKHVLYLITKVINEIELNKIKSFDYKIKHTTGTLFLDFITPNGSFSEPNRVIVNLKDGTSKIFKFYKLKSSLIKFVDQANLIINNQTK